MPALSRTRWSRFAAAAGRELLVGIDRACALTQYTGQIIPLIPAGFLHMRSSHCQGAPGSLRHRSQLTQSRCITSGHRDAAEAGTAIGTLGIGRRLITENKV